MQQHRLRATGQEAAEDLGNLMGSQIGESPAKGHQAGQGAGEHSIWGEAQGAASVQPGGEKAQGRPYRCLQLPGGTVKRRATKLFAEVHSGRERDNEHIKF